MELLHLLVIAILISGSQCYRIVCVYTNWSQYRPDGGKFLPEDVDPTLCTHLIYVYAKIKGNKLIAVEWNDEGTRWSDGMYDRVNNLKQINPDLKTLLGVGGWMMGSQDFSRMAAGRNSRRIFAQSTVKFLRKRGFDGLTIDWQYPTMRGGRPRDRVNFSLLLKELRTAFDDESKRSGTSTLLLTAGVSASKNIIDNAYEIDNITRYTDFVNVMAYDLHGPWENFTGHPSPLYPRLEELGPIADINVDTAMKYWIDNVADRSKLVLGIAAYGRTFTLKDPKYTGFMVPTVEPGTAGEFTREPGMIAFYERCNEYFDATHVWDNTSKVSYWYRGDQWVATEDIESVKAKVRWTQFNQVGGAMLWSLDMDDFLNSCKRDIYQLLRTINIEAEQPLSKAQILEMENIVKTMQKKIITTTPAAEEFSSAAMSSTDYFVPQTTQSPTTTKKMDKNKIGLMSVPKKEVIGRKTSNVKKTVDLRDQRSRDLRLLSSASQMPRNFKLDKVTPSSLPAKDQNRHKNNKTPTQNLRKKDIQTNKNVRIQQNKKFDAIPSISKPSKPVARQPAIIKKNTDTTLKGTDPKNNGNQESVSRDNKNTKSIESKREKNNVPKQVQETKPMKTKNKKRKPRRQLTPKQKAFLRKRIALRKKLMANKKGKKNNSKAITTASP